MLHTARLFFEPSRVITIGHHDYRLKIAEQYGAETTINSNNQDIEAEIKDLTDGMGAEVVIECVGTSECLQQCIQIVRPGGTVSFVGLFFEPFPLNITDFFLRNLTLHGGVAPVRTYIPQLIPLVEQGKLDPTLVISHRISLDEVPKGYELMNNRAEGAIKIVFKP